MMRILALLSALALLVALPRAKTVEHFESLLFDRDSYVALLPVTHPLSNARSLTLKDLAGDNDHWSADIVSEQFRGKSRVAQHQMVYAALKGRMGGVLHALALTTAVPR